jgi:hypothetical protein
MPPSDFYPDFASSDAAIDNMDSASSEAAIENMEKLAEDGDLFAPGAAFRTDTPSGDLADQNNDENAALSRIWSDGTPNKRKGNELLTSASENAGASASADHPMVMKPADSEGPGEASDVQTPSKMRKTATTET